MRDINVKLNRLLTKSKKALEGELTKIVTRYILNNTAYREVFYFQPISGDTNNNSELYSIAGGRRK
mgnify:CR=1 FL=1